MKMNRAERNLAPFRQGVLPAPRPATASEVAALRHEILRKEIIERHRVREVERIHALLLIASVGGLMAFVRVEFLGAMIPVLPDLLRKVIEWMVKLM